MPEDGYAADHEEKRQRQMMQPEGLMTDLFHQALFATRRVCERGLASAESQQ